MLLTDVSVTDGVLEVTVAPDTASPFEVRFIADGGTVVATSSDAVARFDTRAGGHLYVRATVVDTQGRHAWVQPVFVAARRDGL